MKKICILFYLLLPLLFYSCGKQAEIFPKEENILLTKSEGLQKVYPIDQPYSYEGVDSKEFWSRFTSLNERFTAFKIDPALLKDMSTKALVKTMLRYPMNFIVFAYNNPADAISLVIDKSALHQELCKREDLFQVIIPVFNETNLSFDKDLINLSSNTISYADEIFLEYFIIYILEHSEYSNSADYELLKKASNRKLQERLNNRKDYSSYSTLPLTIILQTVERFSTATMLTTPPTTGYTKTPLGQSITVLYYDEMSDSEIIKITNAMITAFPSAICRRTASQKYNCHSYAWISTAATNSQWLNASYGGVLQLSKYWTNDLYISCSSGNEENIYYTYGDHSAKKVATAGMYISKWGAGPVMEHTLTDCPYTSTDIQYFKVRSTPATIPVNGETLLTIGETYIFSVDASPSDLNMTWSVNDYGAGSQSYSLYQPTGANCLFVPRQTNGFVIQCDGYYGSTHVFQAVKTVFAGSI